MLTRTDKEGHWSIWGCHGNQARVSHQRLGITTEIAHSDFPKLCYSSRLPQRQSTNPPTQELQLGLRTSPSAPEDVHHFTVRKRACGELLSDQEGDSPMSKRLVRREERDDDRTPLDREKCPSKNKRSAPDDAGEHYNTAAKAKRKIAASGETGQEEDSFSDRLYGK